MRKSSLALAVLAALPLASMAADNASLTAVGVISPSLIESSTNVGAATFTFSGLTLNGLQFTNLTTAGGPFTGSLTSVSVNATLDASVDYTYADDLTVYVDVLPLSTGGLLQVGGFSSLSALETHSWANGASSDPGTTVIDTVTLTTPISFLGTAADPVIWLGNGYNGGTNTGTWSGTVTLNFTSAVPEPSSWALMAGGGLGMVGWLARRRRRSASAS